MISRRQFFGQAMVGVVGVAAIPFMPWDRAAQYFRGLFLADSKPYPVWRKIYGGVRAQRLAIYSRMVNPPLLVDKHWWKMAKSTLPIKHVRIRNRS